MELAGLTPAKSSLVSPPRVKESGMNMECKVRGRGLFTAFVARTVVAARQCCVAFSPHEYSPTLLSCTWYHIPPVPPNVFQCNLLKGQHAYMATPNDGIVSDGPWSYGG